MDPNAFEGGDSNSVNGHDHLVPLGGDSSNSGSSSDSSDDTSSSSYDSSPSGY